jgi:hypothetical protein
MMWAAWALGAALALPLVVYASIGTFARYTADDYCWAGILRTEGFFKAQIQWYTGYSPRYAFTFLVNLVELAGPAIVPFLPALAILVWLATLAWTFAQFGLKVSHAVLVAEAAAFAIFQTAPDLPQSLYWQTGMLTYLLPLVLATFLIGWIRRNSEREWAPIVGGVVTFVAGGLSETYLIPQNVALTLALAAAVALRARRSTVLHLACALAGGVLALLVIVTAPATTYRVGGPPADLLSSATAAIATATEQIRRLVRYFPLTMLFCLALPTVIGTGQIRIATRWFWLVTAAVAITFPFCYFPSFFANNGNPPARALIVPGSILISYLLWVGALLAPLVKQRLTIVARVGVAAVLTVAPLMATLTSLPERALAAEQAALWDAGDHYIRASRDAGELDISVPPRPRYLGEAFVTSDRANWFNVCVARYYGVRTIAAN